VLLNTNRAQNIIKEAGLDVLIATSPDNVTYMSDYVCLMHRLTSGLQLYGILPCDDSVQPGLVIPSVEVDAWAELPGGIKDVTVYGTVHRHHETTGPFALDDQLIYDLTVAGETHGDATDALHFALSKRGMIDSAIGLDESNLSVNGWAQIVDAFPRARLVPAASLFRLIRMVKTETEIERLSHSAQITETAIQDVFRQVRQGMTEKQLAQQLKARMAELGGDPAFSLVSAGYRTAHTGHNYAREPDYLIREGDLIKIDAGCTYGFYWSDVSRTKTFGAPGRHESHLYEILCAGQRAALAHARSGIRASELFETTVATIRELGISDYKRHHCGHGIGIAVYDPPLVQPHGYRDMFGIGSNDPVLENGMVINLEMPYYVLGKFGFNVEDPIVVRDDGPQLLTHLDHALSIVT